jgi:glucoamylase
MTAQLPRAGTLALGFSSSREAAATLVLQSLAAGFETRWAAYCQGWQQWLDTLRWPPATAISLSDESLALLRRSATVIKSHEDHTFPGAFVASLSVPWGEASTSRGGYHLVWARDLVETAGALVALGCVADAQRILIYLIATQQANGHWLQNQWLGGKPFWQGIQLDETAFPVLLASALAERDALGEVRVDDMVRRALGFIAREGPVTSQDRWEEDTGVNTFTVAPGHRRIGRGQPVPFGERGRLRTDAGRRLERTSGRLDLGGQHQTGPATRRAWLLHAYRTGRRADTRRGQAGTPAGQKPCA